MRIVTTNKLSGLQRLWNKKTSDAENVIICLVNVTCDNVSVSTWGNESISVDSFSFVLFWFFANLMFKNFVQPSFFLLMQYLQAFKPYKQIDLARLVLKNILCFATQHNNVAVIIVRSVLLHQNAWNTTFILC